MALEIPHSKGWARILRSGGPESANPVSGPQVSSRPNEKGVGGRHGETVLEFSCPNRPGTKLTCQASGTATRARPPTRHFFRHSEEVGAGGSSRSSYPATPPPTTAQEGYGQGSLMQDAVQLHDHDLRHGLDDWPQRRASQGLLPVLDVRDRPGKTATPPCENPGRLETELLTRACRAQLSQQVSHPVHNPVGSSAAPRSSFRSVPNFHLSVLPTQQRTALSLILSSITVLWDNPIDTSLP